MSKMPYSLAILGAGIGAEHLAGLQPLQRQFQVDWICDLDQTRAKALADDCGARTTSEIDVVLSDPDVVVLAICLPPSLHVPVTLRALAAGKHVVCEKPIAASLRDVDRIEAAAQSAGRRVFPVFQYRYGVAMRIVNAMLKQNFLGPLRAATLETHWNRDADYYAVPWRGTMAYEMGGAVLSHAIHIHDLIHALGGPITQVSATLATLSNPIETEDTAAIWMRADRGALITSSITLGAATDHSRLRLVYDRATLESGTDPYTPAAKTWTLTARDPELTDAFASITESVLLTPGPHHSGFSGFYADVAKALDGRRAAVDLSNGRASIELASAIYLSAAERRTVDLSLTTTADTYDGWAAAGHTTEPA